MVLLAGFATLNAAFFPAGDVLLLFVVVGIVLFIVRKWSDKAILITAILFSLQPIEWFHYIMSLFNPAYTPARLKRRSDVCRSGCLHQRRQLLGVPDR